MSDDISQVVCISPKAQPGKPWHDIPTGEAVGPAPVFGGIYTVTAFDGYGYKFAEFDLPINRYWLASVFRPVRRTSIESFREALQPMKVARKRIAAAVDPQADHPRVRAQK